MKKHNLHLILIAVAGLIVYSNTFHVPFQFDDLWNLSENPIIKNLDNFISSSKGYAYNPRRFIGYFSFALNYHFGGLDVTGYHIVNLAIHIISAILVYFMVILTFRTPIWGRWFLECFPVSEKHSKNQRPQQIALFSALLFVVHPVQTQAVTYIVQRFASLTAMFYLLSVVMYIKGRLTGGDYPPSPIPLPQGEGARGRVSSTSGFFFYGTSLLSAILAMKTKETAFTLPVIIILYEFTFFKSTMKKKLFFIVPILATMLIIPLSILGTNRPLGEILSDMSDRLRVDTHISRLDYLWTQMRVITTYIRLIFFPINQNLDYNYPVYHSLFAMPVLFSFLFLAALFGLGVYLVIRKMDSRLNTSGMTDKKGDSRFTIHDSRPLRLIGFGILWFFITLSVESSFIPIADVIFEHRLYLPLAGALIAIVTAVFVVAERVIPPRPPLEKGGTNIPPVPKGRLGGIIVLALITVVLSGAAYSRNMVWQDEITLWQDVISKSPRDARAYNNLGYIYLSKGDVEKAISSIRNSLSIEPNSYDALTNLGVAYYDKGLYDYAILYFQAALNLASSKVDKADFMHDIGLAFAMEGRLDNARTEMESALTFDPGNPEIYSDLGAIYNKEGMTDKAIECFRKALQIQPDYAPARYNMAIAYKKK